MKTSWLFRFRDAFTACILAGLLGILPSSAGEAHGQPGRPAHPYQGWQHSGGIYILTTPEGAGLLGSASEEGFPLLVRLDKEFFDFTQAKASGEDVRWSTTDGIPLAYEVEEWDAAKGSASVWVRLPMIRGNAREELRLYWGKADATSESSGAAVFNDELTQIKRHRGGETEGRQKESLTHGKKTPEIGVNEDESGTETSMVIQGASALCAAQSGRQEPDAR